MRSYVKAYQKGRLFYAELGQVPDQSPEVTWAILRPKKQNFIDLLNYGYNNFVAVTYFGTDPNLGVALASLYPAGFIQFEDYSLHPRD